MLRSGFNMDGMVHTCKKYDPIPNSREPKQIKPWGNINSLKRDKPSPLFHSFIYGERSIMPVFFDKILINILWNTGSRWLMTYATYDCSTSQPQLWLVCLAMAGKGAK